MAPLLSLQMLDYRIFSALSTILHESYLLNRIFKLSTYVRMYYYTLRTVQLSLPFLPVVRTSTSTRTVHFSKELFLLRRGKYGTTTVRTYVRAEGTVKQFVFLQLH